MLLIEFDLATNLRLDSGLGYLADLSKIGNCYGIISYDKE
jgi:hypothetical protein